MRDFEVLSSAGGMLPSLLCLFEKFFLYDSICLCVLGLDLPSGFERVSEVSDVFRISFGDLSTEVSGSCLGTGWKWLEMLSMTVQSCAVKELLIIDLYIVG